MKKYGTSAKVGNTEINVYTEGSGTVTIIFMSGSGIGCPALEYKPLYRRMSDKFRIAVVEKAGYGLSGSAETPRTVENLVEESRAALKSLNILPPYILAPHSYSGFEAIWWANTYPEEVKAVLGVDMGFPNMMTALGKEIPPEKKKAMVDKTRIETFKKNGIKYVMWQTQGDIKVCDECKERNGTIYPLSEYPGKAHYNCRCWLVPVLKKEGNNGES